MVASMIASTVTGGAAAALIAVTTAGRTGMTLVDRHLDDVLIALFAIVGKDVAGDRACRDQFQEQAPDREGIP